ncbi:F-type H+-transporting ATPase subunit epsilon [Melghirimyces profundicolus]|uniref:ATP synthase epsilon chain n=1 Tax=Melghirimyces profundicolus TaxID=1242148 RepID=A0A2T6C2H7_9BACL|nr:F0F1 ATP synthase subunit epsilon [Melghirimyces profundicolus]PTX62518.1 F-type H+-transporting ATPase subunit epsilon [Melghirimyces profundicolus]
MSTMQLDIVTPERKVYSEQVEMVIARAAEGDIGILPNHSPFVSPLKITAVKVKKGGEEFLVAVSGGFIEVRGGTVTILAEAAELPDEIDVERAKKAKKRAEERLADKQREDIDFKRAEIALQKATVRIQVGKSG